MDPITSSEPTIMAIGIVAVSAIVPAISSLLTLYIFYKIYGAKIF